MNDKEQVLISEFHKNSTELVRVHLSEFKNKLYCNIRIWTADEPQEWRPSYKGITLNVDLLPKLHEAIGRAMEELKTRSKALETEDSRKQAESVPECPQEKRSQGG